MRRIAIFAAAVVLVAAAPVWAAEKTTEIPTAPHVVLVQGGSFALSSSGYSVPLTGVAGLFGWGPSYRLDAGVEPNLTGGFTAGVGATIGAGPGESGSGYSLRMGGGWTRLGAMDGFSVNPVSRLGLAEITSTGSDVALSFTYRRSIATGLSLTGAAEAHRSTAGTSVVDPLSGASQFVLGAGIALRF
jgi:hypothetical protein